LKWIDDDVRHVSTANGTECLSDREGGAAIGESHLNDNVSVVSNEDITQNVAIRGGERDALEIAFERSLSSRARRV
jgi:hypothetical protein